MDRISLIVMKAALRAKLRRWFGGVHDLYLPLPEGAILSPSIGIARALTEVERKLGCNRIGTDSPETWQNKARNKLTEITGYQESRMQPTVTMSKPAVQLGDGLVRESFYLRVRPDTDLPVHLIYREQLTSPAPVFLHLAGSTSGVHLAWGDVRVPIDHQRISVGADMAKQAAQRGYIGVAIEQAGYGERGERVLPKRSANRTIDIANHLLLLGRTLMGDGASDVSSAIDWLLGGDCPVCADDSRLFLFGHSAGGTLAQYCAALDTRIAGVLASGSVGPIRDTIAARGAGGGDGIVPGLLNWLDSADLAALVAPRKFVGLSGTRDHIFPYPGVKKVVEGAHPVFEKMGAGSAVQAVQVDGAHSYYGTESWAAWKRFIDPPAAAN